MADKEQRKPLPKTALVRPLTPADEGSWTEPAPLEVLVAFHGVFPWTSFDCLWLLDRQFSLRIHQGGKP